MIREINLFSCEELSVDWADPMALILTISHSLLPAFSPLETLSVILTAITAGPSLGFNRAMVFLVEGEHLAGKYWLGPKSPDEAGKIWTDLSRHGSDMEAIVAYNKDNLLDSDSPLNQRIQTLRFPFPPEEPAPIPTSCLTRHRLIWVQESGREPAVAPDFLNLINTEEFVCAPLISHDKPVGVIVVDNAITNQPIDDRSLALLSIAAPLAAVAIDNAHLMEETVVNAKALEEAYNQIRNQQETLLRMERLSAIGQVVSIISHEIRNPLSVIGGFARAMLRDDLITGDSRHQLEIIRDEVRRLEDLLNNIAFYLRRERGEEALIPVDGGVIMARVLKMLEPQFAAQNIRIENHLPSGLKIMALGELFVDHCFLNIIRNSLESMSAGGTLTVDHSQIDDRRSIIIRDTGSGLSEEARAKVFAPFFTTKSRGLGLGLAFVKDVMLRSDGEVGIESVQGEGTTVTLRFKTPGGDGEGKND